MQFFSMLDVQWVLILVLFLVSLCLTWSDLKLFVVQSEAYVDQCT